MTSSRIATVMTALLLAAALAGCGSQQEPAQAALAAINTTMEGNGPQVEKYLPERHAEISARVEALRASYEAGDYRKVVADAPAVTDTLRRAVADAAIERANIKLQMEAEWVEFVNTMPGLIGKVDQQIAQMGRGKLPAGVSRDAFKAAAADFDGAKAAWGRAAEAGNAGKLEDAVMAAREAKTAMAGVMETLGIQAS